MARLYASCRAFDCFFTPLLPSCLPRTGRGAVGGQGQRTAHICGCSQTRFGLNQSYDYNLLVGGDYYLYVDILAGYGIGSWFNCRDRLHGNQKRWLAVGLVRVGYPNCCAGDLVFHHCIKKAPAREV